MESICNVVSFVRIREDAGTPVVLFAFNDFAMLDMHGELALAKYLWIELDLESKCMVKAVMDGRELTAEEAVILLWHHNISAGHVKLHAFANWGVNIDAPDPFVRRNSIITVMYNYFGFTVFKGLASFWHAVGAARYDFSKIYTVFEEGVKAGINFHGSIDKLARFSEVVDFSIKVRNKFINEFAKHKKDFPGIEGEALFVGTVLHSLDHTLMDWNMEDAMWLDVDHPEFGMMAELGRFVNAGFVSDLPGLVFEKSFKDAPHPFYQQVYGHAARINTKLANHMDTCVVK